MHGVRYYKGPGGIGASRGTVQCSATKYLAKTGERTNRREDKSAKLPMELLTINFLFHKKRAKQ